jgi:hypothetical protein
MAKTAHEHAVKELCNYEEHLKVWLEVFQ